MQQECSKDLTELRDIKLLLDQFTPVAPRQPSELVRAQLCQAVKAGALRPGQKLPPESLMVERFGTGRGPVREALLQLEAFGITEFRAPNHYFVRKVKRPTLLAMFAHLDRLGPPDYSSYLTARTAVEIAMFEARAEGSKTGQTSGALSQLQAAVERHKKSVQEGEAAEEEEAVVHLELAGAFGEAGEQRVVGLLTPEILQLTVEYNINRGQRPQEIAQANQKLLAAVEGSRWSEAAAVLREVTTASIAVFEASQAPEKGQER